MKNIFTPNLIQRQSADTRGAVARIFGGHFAQNLKLHLFSAMLLFSMLLGAGGVYGQVTHTVCPTGCDFTTVQAAYTAAASGDIIDVSDGSYSLSSLTLNKSMTIKGNNAGIAAADGTGTPPSGRLPETELTVSGELRIAADDITIDGMYLKSGERVIRNGTEDAINFILENCLIENTSAPAFEMLHFFGSAVRENWIIRNNRFSGAQGGTGAVLLGGNGNDGILVEENDFMGTGGAAMFGEASNLTIRSNYFASTNLPATNMNGLSNPTIEDNIVNVNGIGFQLATSDGGVIRNNTFVGVNDFDAGSFMLMRGIDIFGTTFSGPNSSGLVIENNVFQDFTAPTINPDDQYRGIHMRQGAEGILIRGNIFSNSHTALGIVATTPAVQDITLEENDLSGVVFGIRNGSSESVDAPCNWWGTTEFSDIEDLIEGGAEFVPYLSDGTDVDPVTPGFQPTPFACTGGCPGGGSVINLNTGLSYCSIQDAINDPATLAGHIITVAAGTYAENVVINKSLTLNGANANIACGSRVAEALVAPASGLPVSITADGVTLNGFEISAPSSTNAVSIGSNRSNVSVVFNNIHDIGTTVTNANVHAIVHTVANVNSTSNITISDNCFDNISSSGLTGFSASAIGILQSTTTGDLTGLNIERNTINDVTVNTGDWPTGKIAYGIQINVGGNSSFQTNGKVVDAIIRNNEISNLSGFISTGIGLEGNTEGAVVENNSVSALSGRKLADRSGGGYDLSGLKFENNRYVSTVTVQNNSFQTNTFVHDGTPNLGYAISNYVTVADGGEASINCNWLGTAVFSEIEDNPALDGKIFNKDNCVTNFVPYLTDGTDDDPVAIGFQPAVGSCNGGPVKVFSDATETNLLSIHASIQAGIDAAVNGNVVRVDAGIYDEVLLVNKSVSILGPNDNISAVNGTRLPEARLLQRINIDETEDVTISGFEFFEVQATSTWTIYIYGNSNNFAFENNRFVNCQKDAIRSGISSSTGNITVTGNLIQGMSNTLASGILLGGIYGTSVIADNKIDLENDGYSGIQTPSATGLTISGNDISNTTNQGIQLAGACGDVVIENNVVSNTNTSNGADKGAIRLYGTDFTGTITITGNILISSYNGISVKDGEDITGKNFVIENNDLSGNSNKTIYNGASAGILSTSCNWFGSDDYSTVEASIDGDVEFVPYLVSGTDDDPIAIGFQPEPTACAGGPVQVYNGTTLISGHALIQEAIDASTTMDGYIVRISSGTYTENVDADTGGKSLVFAPGASPGCVTINGNFILNAGDVLEMEIEGTDPCNEHDQFIINGDLDITGASLVVPTSFFVPSATDEITLFDVSGSRTGFFTEGTFVVSGSQTYYVNYNVSGSSDIVLTKCCSGLLDLGIFNAASTPPPTGNKLEIKVRPNNDIINGAYSSGIFTIRTLTANNVSFTNEGSPYGFIEIDMTTDATYTYYTYYFEAGIPYTVDWDKDTEYTVLTLGYACIGDAVFELTNASPTPNTVYYQELNAAEATGIFYEPSVTSPSDVTVVAGSNSPVCETMSIQLDAEASNGSPAYTYAWTGPNGFSSGDQSPVIDPSSLVSAGTYTVIATDMNGCTGSTTTEVLIPLAGTCVENIDTDLLYPTITQAIADANTMNGHTLEVPEGNWPEAVNVTKELTINGANAGTPCDDTRATESVISAGLGTAVNILSDGVTLDGFTIEGSTGVVSNGFDNIAILNNIIGASILGIGASDMSTASDPYTIQGNCVELSQQTYEAFGFSPLTPLTLEPTQTPGAWYTDRYAPAGFVIEPFDGDFRLKHSINDSDCESCRPGGFNSAFYNTQGRKYDIDGTTAMSIDLYVPSAWATSDSRMAGFWGTMVDASDAITLYPILEFTSDGNDPRFRAWDGDWIDMGLPAGFTYDTWYTLTIKLEGSVVKYYVDDLTLSIPALGSVDLTNVILQGHNTPAPGVTYDIYWDNLLLLDNPAANPNTPTTGVAVVNATGAAAVTLENNSVSDAFYGYVLGGVDTDARTVVREGTFTGLMQGVSVTNAASGLSYVPSNVGVEDLEMTDFAGDHPTFAAINFHSGIYAFTGGADPAAIIDILVDNVTVSNTGNISPNSAGIHFADFSTGAGNRLTAVVNESTISDNLNRGVYVRGENAFTEVTNSEILGNGGDPHGLGGNDGYGVIANNGTSITLTNNYIENPATQVGYTVTAIFNGVAPASTIVATENHLNRNGNGDLTSNSYAIANFTATCNWWGSDDIDVVDGLVSNNVLFLPYLNDDTDTDLALKGFQPDPMTCVQPTHWYVNDNAATGDVFTTGLGDNNNPGTKSRPLLTIGAAVSLVNGLMTGATPDTIFIDAGGYNEQVIVPNTTTNLHLIGVGSCDDPMATTTTIDFTGTVSGKPTLLDVAGDGTVIDGIHFNVDLTKLSSAIIASDAGIDTVTIRNNCIDPYRFNNNPYLAPYGDRNAININHSTYRISGTNPSFTVTGNRISYNFNGTPMDPSDDAGFRAGVATDEGVGLVDGNILQTINHDVEVRFSGTGDITLTNNTFNGGGVNLADYNNFPGDVTVSDNTFNGEFGSSFTSALRARNNEHGRETTISNNTFTGHNWGISLENYPDVTVSGNTFTPLASSSSFRHITVNTKSISSNSSTIVQVPINGSILNNTFNVNPSPGGTALAFYNHDSDDADIGTFTVEGNTFPDGFSWAVYLGDQLGSTLDPAALALFPEYNLGAGSDTEMACWNEDIDIQNNLFDVGLGSGLQTPPTMNNAERNALEVILWHLPDNACLGELIYFLPVEVMAKVFLQGPYDTAADLMKDDLRAAGLIPVMQPYSSINVLFPGSFTSVNNFVTEVVNPTVFDLTGNNAIVDWVWLELRDMNDHNTVVATRSALVQRDGDIVDLDGSSDVLFPDTYTGEYYLLVRHRNHLGAMTAAPVDFSTMTPTLVDFASPAQATFGTSATSARRLIDTNTYGLWAGNTIPFAGGNFEVKYNGSSNDRLPILNFVGASTPLNVVSNVYARQDVNMDGQVKYTGSGNDRIIILNNIGAGDPLNSITQEPNN